MTGMAAPEPLSPQLSTTLADFARTTKAAARSVSLYPSTHPSIQAALRRVHASAQRLAPSGSVTLTIQPDGIAVDSRSAARPDAAIGELATLLHERLVGELQFHAAATVDDWLALLLLLSKSPEDLFAEGGLAQAWAATGRAHFEIREIDYAEVLRERKGGGEAAWDRIIAFCLAGDGGSIDDSALDAAFELIGDPARFNELVGHLEAAASDATMGARAAALLKLLHTLVDAAKQKRPDDIDRLLDTAGEAVGRLTPEMLYGLIAEARGGTPEQYQTAQEVLGHVTDEAVTTFVAREIAAERGATERLAQAFETLVPDLERKDRLLDAVKEEVEATELGRESGFENLWKDAAGMLKSYSDKPYVGEEYGRELSGARAQALEIERVSDDPPDRIQAWLKSVSDEEIGALDLALILDLLRLQKAPAEWTELARIAAREIERRTVLGTPAQVQPLLDALAREREGGEPEMRAAAAAAIATLAEGPLVRHVVLQLRKAEDNEVAPLNQLAHTIGPALVRPFAEALAVEQNARGIRRLRELLLGFGAAGRQSVEQLKNSTNPAVRRTAIDLLRVFGGEEALPELASLLEDADPQVQRESIRAIVQIGTPKAFAVLERHLTANGASREAILQHLIGLRDERSIPLLSHVIERLAPRGALIQIHVDIMDVLGSLKGTSDSIRVLRAALFRGEWWAPVRTATLRKAAAAALRRIGTPEALAALEEAVTRGNRNVRNIARQHTPAVGRRDRERG